MTRVQSLLADTDLPVQCVATLTGYDDPRSSPAKAALTSMQPMSENVRIMDSAVSS
ncbi:hypothetical protein M1D51_02910 [Arthrobacter sp. R3-55]